MTSWMLLSWFSAQVPATVNFLNKNLTKVIIDSESDITLISQKSLSEMQTPIKLQQGQVNLVQVTGNASISGYVDIDLYFHTPDGPIKINVKAHVVKGISTPLILGNDFVDSPGRILHDRIWRLQPKNASE